MRDTVKKRAGKVLEASVVALTIMTGAGCVGPITHMPDASPQSVQKARAEFHQFDGAKERQVGKSQSEQVAAVERVRQRVFPAAQRVCERFFSHGCAASLQSMKVVVYTDSPEVNAFAAQTGELGIFGGLVLETGSDDELAMVLAHEVAHIMYGHNQKVAQNTGGGMLLGAALGIALGAAIYEPGMNTGYIGDLGESGMQIGGGLGSVAYSPEMELEADHFAAFVLKEAGYDPRKGGRFIVRAWRRGNAEHSAGRKSFVSYFGTHPADDHRLAQWQEAVAAIGRGQNAPLTPAQVQHMANERAQANRTERYNSEECEQIRTKYPKCKWWNGKYDMAWGWDCPTKGIFPLMIPDHAECTPPDFW